MNAQLIHVNEVGAQAWRNGSGITRELLIAPASEDWRWRISVADIGRDATFSLWPGVARWFVPIEGSGVELCIDGRTRIVRLGDQPVAFDGGATTTCRLLDGPTRDLNLMLRDASGSMCRVVDDEVWSPAASACGLFAAQAGVCHSGPSAIAVSAGTLVWWADAPQQLRFTVSADASEAAGWWLSATRDHKKAIE